MSEVQEVSKGQGRAEEICAVSESKSNDMEPRAHSLSNTEEESLLGVRA
jgi:hypothetical protein